MEVHSVENSKKGEVNYMQIESSIKYLLTEEEPKMSDSRSKIAKIDATAAEPLARSEVMLPALAITFPC